MNTAIVKTPSIVQERVKTGRPNGMRHANASPIVPPILSRPHQSIVPPESGSEEKTKLSPVWLGLYFSQMALISTQSTHSRNKGHINHPLVVVEMQQNQSRVYRANKQAKAQGIEKGCLLNAAYVLCRNLEVISRNQSTELLQLKQYVQRVTRFTPQIVLSGTDTILLEVRHSLHLFGGLKSLLTQLKQAFPDVLLHLACAPTPLAAELMARNGIQKLISHRQHLRSTLGSILLHQAMLKPALIHKLERCGLSCLHDLWRLPRAGLARRFGPELLQHLDRLSGSIEFPQAYFEMEHHFSIGYDFDQETELTPLLLHAAEVLLQQAQQFLQVRALLSEEVNFHFVYTHRSGETCQGHSLSVYAQQGGNTVAHFLPQLGEHLQRLRFKKAVIRMELHISQFRLRQDSTLDLFRRSRENTQSWSMLLDSLAARLGKNAVYRLLAQADHCPEKAWYRHYTGGEQSGVMAHLSLPLPLPPRPLWLLPQPLKLVRATFTLLANAERLESGWWSGEDMRREYYQGISSFGQRYWLFRDLKARQEQWYLHGLFA